MCVSGQFAALRNRDLRELLEDEDRISRIVRSSEKLQGLQRSIERTLLLNYKLAKANLSQKPKFKDTKLLLAMKYKELDKLRNIIQAKKEQLAGKYTFHHAHWRLLRRIDHAEEECELLFQRFAERKTPLSDLLDSFLSARTLHHIRLVLAKELQERIAASQPVESPSVPAGCPPVCGLTPALVWPACCLVALPVRPPFLLPLDSPQPPGLRFDPEDYYLQTGLRGRAMTRPAHLQPLRVEGGRHRPAPQWSSATTHTHTHTHK